MNDDAYHEIEWKHGKFLSSDDTIDQQTKTSSHDLSSCAIRMHVHIAWICSMSTNACLFIIMMKFLLSFFFSIEELKKDIYEKRKTQLQFNYSKFTYKKHLQSTQLFIRKQIKKIDDWSEFGKKPSIVECANTLIFIHTKSSSYLKKTHFMCAFFQSYFLLIREMSSWE